MTRRLAAVLVLAAVAAGGTVVAVRDRGRSVVERSWRLGPGIHAVTTGAGDVTVAPGGTPSVDVLRRATGSSPPDVAVAARDGVVRLVGGCPGTEHLHWLFFSTRCSARWRLRLSRSGPLAVGTRVGDVVVTGLAGPLDAHAGVGDVLATALTARTTTLGTQVGDVRATFASTPARVAARAGIGDVELVLPRGAYDLQLHAGVGAVHVGPGILDDQRSTRRIAASADVGDVRVVAHG